MREPRALRLALAEGGRGWVEKQGRLSVDRARQPFFYIPKTLHRRFDDDA